MQAFVSRKDRIGLETCTTAYALSCTSSIDSKEVIADVETGWEVKDFVAELTKVMEKQGLGTCVIALDKTGVHKNLLQETTYKAVELAGICFSGKLAKTKKQA